MNSKGQEKNLNDIMKRNSRSGDKRQSGIITEEVEKELWQKGILSVPDPPKLLRTVYFL